MHGMLRMPCPHRTVSHLLRKQTLNNLSQPPISVRALNTEGVAASLTEQNQLSRDAQKAERQKLGLSHTDSLANIVNASWKIKEMDLEYRKSMDPNDTSTDVLGIVQYSSLHDGLAAGLFHKAIHYPTVRNDPDGKMCVVLRCDRRYLGYITSCLWHCQAPVEHLPFVCPGRVFPQRGRFQAQRQIVFGACPS